MKRERLDKFSIRKLTVGAASVLIGVAFGATTVSAATGQSTPATSQQTPAVAPQNAPAVVEATNKENNAKFLKQMTDGAIQKLKEKLANATGEEKLSLQAKLADAQKSLTDAQKSLTDAEANVTKTQDNIQEAIVAAKLEAAKTADEVKAIMADPKKPYSDDVIAAKSALAAAKKAAHEEFTKAGITGKIFHDAIDAAKTLEGLKAYVAETLAAHKTPAVDALAEAKKVAHEEFTKAGITGKIFHDAIDAAKTVEGLQAYVAETLAAHKTPAVDALAEAKKAAHEEFTKAGITGKIFHDAIDAAKTLEGLKAYVAETLKAHKTVEPVTPTPAPVVSGETGIGYLNLDMLSDGFTGTLYVPVVGKDVNCKVRLLDDAGKYTNDYVVTDTTVKALASKVVNGVTFYKVAENRWIPAKFAEVLSDKEVAFKGVAKTFVKGHANYAVAMLDANGKYTGKFLKQGSSFKVFAKKVINGHLCYRLGTQAQWVPARFLVF